MIYKNNKLVVNLLHGNTIIDKVYKNNLVVYQKNKTDELPNYFKITAREPGTINFSKTNKEIYWSTNGKSWTLSPTSESTISVEATTGTNLYLRGNWLDLRYELGKGPLIATTCKYDISGNIFSLIYNEDFEDKTAFPTDLTSFDYFFSGDLNLINAKDLILPATTLNDYCYYCMFSGCTSLTTAPELPATTLTEGCYELMFNGCTSLTTAPELPATTLTNYCYNAMFAGCTRLTTAPELPATTLAENCYHSMFYGCKNLTTAPVLPATTLANSCYSAMFYECTRLTKAPKLPATTLANFCYSAMFLGCTSLTSAPELPVTTLAENCYSLMFYGCTNLTTAPELPATTLVNYCYHYMFNDCTNLNYIKAMFTTEPGQRRWYTTMWVYGVSPTGTFIKNSAATWNVTGANGIPKGWTVELADS